MVYERTREMATCPIFPVIADFHLRTTQQRLGLYNAAAVQTDYGRPGYQRTTIALMAFHPGFLHFWLEKWVSSSWLLQEAMC